MPVHRRPRDSRDRFSASPPTPLRSDSHQGGGRSRRPATRDSASGNLRHAKNRYKRMYNEFAKLIIKSSEACEACEHFTQNDALKILHNVYT